MRALNDLSKQERLELYRKALKDWKKFPNNSRKETNDGLCRYFAWMHDIECCDYTSKGESYGNHYPLVTDKCGEFVIHVNTHLIDKGFLGKVGDPIPRIAALKAMIAQLEEELK